MFEAGDEELWADADFLMPPSDDDEWGPWEADDTDAWVDELVALDPERPRQVGEQLRDAERLPASSWLASLDLGSLNDDEKIAVVIAAQRMENHYAALRLEAAAAFAGGLPLDDRDERAFAWCELATALHTGDMTARGMVDHARRLRTHLPRTLAAMRSGELSWRKASVLLDATSTMTVEQCAQMEERVLPKAGERTNAQHSERVRYHARKVDPDGWKRRREQKLADVAMIRTEHGDGVADVLLRHLDTLEATTIWQAADTRARQQKAAGDPRTLDALRCAAVYDWACKFLTGQPIGPDENPQPAPTRNGAAATVNVFITLPDAIATLAGGEPLPAEAVAELLHTGARIRFALTDGHGRLVGISTKLHDPTALMRVWLALRDVTARSPNGSVAPVAGQDWDHINPNGPTEPGNLHGPTRSWHRAKTFGHWTVTGNADGTLTWTSRRTGRSYTTHPYDHRAGP